MLKKKIWANFQKIIELFTKKIVKKLFKIWSWDPGSEIRDPEKTHSGSRIQWSKRHRIPDPDPQHCSEELYFSMLILFLFYTFIHLMVGHKILKVVIYSLFLRQTCCYFDIHRYRCRVPYNFNYVGFVFVSFLFTLPFFPLSYVITFSLSSFPP